MTDLFLREPCSCYPICNVPVPSGDHYVEVEPDLTLQLQDTGPRWSKLSKLPAGTYAIVRIDNDNAP